MEMIGEMELSADYASVPPTQRIVLRLSHDEAKRLYVALIARGNLADPLVGLLEHAVFVDRPALSEAWNRGDVTSRSMTLVRDGS